MSLTLETVLRYHIVPIDLVICKNMFDNMAIYDWPGGIKIEALDLRDCHLDS